MMALVFFVAPSFAAKGIVETQITRLMADSELFGRCMAKVSSSPHLNSDISDCKSDWVTFDCSGDFASKDVANRSYASAQLALVTEKVVVLTVNNSRKHNGYCWAERINF